MWLAGSVFGGWWGREELCAWGESCHSERSEESYFYFVLRSFEKTHDDKNIRSLSRLMSGQGETQDDRWEKIQYERKWVGTFDAKETICDCNIVIEARLSTHCMVSYILFWSSCLAIPDVFSGYCFNCFTAIDEIDFCDRMSDFGIVKMNHRSIDWDIIKICLIQYFYYQTGSIFECRCGDDVALWTWGSICHWWWPWNRSWFGTL